MKDKPPTVAREAVIGSKAGLHARPSSKFVKLASQFKSEISVTHSQQTVNGKSIMGLLTLAAPGGTKLVIKAVGADAAEAVQALQQLIEDGGMDE